MRKELSILLLGIFFSSVCCGTILVKPGRYTLPVLLMQKDRQVFTAFNRQTKSQLVLILKPVDGLKLPESAMTGSRITIEVGTAGIHTDRADVKLLKVQPLAKDEKPLFYVDNDFQPLKKNR